MRYVAYAVDLSGVAHSTYELECLSDDDAKRRASSFLEANPVIEIWRGARRIARLTSEIAREAEAATESNPANSERLA
jgi:hypothetical protein